MVCVTIPTTPTSAWHGTATQSSDRPARQTFRVQMGLRDKPQRQQIVKLNSQFFRLQGWWNKVSNLHWMTIQDYSASKVSTAHWRTEMACSSYKQKSQHCQKEQSYRYTTQNKDRLACSADHNAFTPQGPADIGYAGDYWEDTFHTVKNTVSSPSRAQPSDSRTVQRIRLRTSVKQWKSQTKHNHTCGKEKQHSGSRKAQNCQKHSSNSLQQRQPC